MTDLCDQPLKLVHRQQKMDQAGVEASHLLRPHFIISFIRRYTASIHSVLRRHASNLATALMTIFKPFFLIHLTTAR